MYRLIGPSSYFIFTFVYLFILAYAIMCLNIFFTTVLLCFNCLCAHSYIRLLSVLIKYSVFVCVRVFSLTTCVTDFCVSRGDLAIGRLMALICDHCRWNAAILLLRSKGAILSYPISILSSSRFSVPPTLGLVFAKKKAISAAQLVARFF